MKQSPKTSIKCRFANQVHKLLEPNISVKRHERWKYPVKLTNEQKLAIFDQIEALHKKTSSEMVNYLNEKRYKKIVNKERIARGWKPKKKTSLAEYNA